MARIPWTPTAEQRLLARAWIRKLQRRDALIRECDTDLAALVDKNGVQVSWLIGESGVERKRFYRELERGRSATDTSVHEIP